MWITFAIIALSALLTLLVVLYIRYGHLYRLSLQFPGPPALPLIGNALIFLGAPPEAIVDISLELNRQYGNTFRFWLGPKLNVVMQNVEDIAVVLASNELTSKSEEYKYLSVWLRDGLLLASGRKWQQRRKLITPAFHFKILEQFIEVFQQQSLVMVQQLQLQLAATEQRAIDMEKLISLCTLDIICETAMGVGVSAQTNANSPYVHAVKSITNVLRQRMSDPIYCFDIIYKFTKLAREGKQALAILHGFTENVIIQRRAELLRAQKQSSAELLHVKRQAAQEEQQLGLKSKKAFLDILLQSEIDGQPLSNLDVREEVDTFMFEGHDTTTSAVMFLFYNLALHTQCQRQCFEEIVRVFGKDKSKPVSYARLNQLHYMELCIKETLRMYPPVGMIGRRVLRDCNINGRVVPAGANIGMSALQLGRQAQLFPEPCRFKPERFDVTHNREKINPYAYIPFSAGPRNCIGQKFAMLEIKSMTANVLRHFEILYAGDPAQTPILTGDLILRTKEPLLFKIRPRVY